MRSSGIRSSRRLEELENHLREDIRVLVEAGKPEAQAFELAVQRLGSPYSLQGEFDKIKRPLIWPVKIGFALCFGAVILASAVLGTHLVAGKISLLLFAHALCVTAGYGLTFVSGGLGICHVCYRSFHALSPVRRQSLNQAVHLFSRLAAVLVVFGVILGMIWAKPNLGRYWGWDPKEIGGLCVIVWLLVLAAVQRCRRIGERAAMLVSIVANAVVGLAWFGAGMIDRSHRTPGVEMAGGWVLLAVFVGVNLCFLIVGMIPAPEAADS